MTEQWQPERSPDAPGIPAPPGRAQKRASVRPLLLIGTLVLGLVLGAALISGFSFWKLLGRGPDPVVVASSSLQSIREQARLTPFVARYVAVVTARQNRFGLTAEKTLIMPGVVRYEIDLAKMRERDLRWDETTKTLAVTLPPLELDGPQIDLNQLREYDGGGILMALTDADSRLDAANRARGQQELLRQAREPLPLRLAGDAAKRAIERSFAMPMKAAGIDATVVATFAGEPLPTPSAR